MNDSDILAPDRSSPSSVPDGAAILAKIRSSGFTMILDDQERPKITPLDLLTEKQRILIRENRELIRSALLSEREKETSQLTPSEDDFFGKLSSWWLSWNPPAEPYSLGHGVMVSDPKMSYEYHVELLRSGCVGQARLALLDWLRRHARKFCGPTLEE